MKLTTFLPSPTSKGSSPVPRHLQPEWNHGVARQPTSLIAAIAFYLKLRMVGDIMYIKWRADALGSNHGVARHSG